MRRQTNYPAPGGVGGGYQWGEQPSQPHIYPLPDVFLNPGSIPFNQISNLVPQFSPFVPNAPHVLPHFQYPFSNGGSSNLVNQFQPLFPNGNFTSSFQPNHDNAHNVNIEKMEKAARKAWCDLLALKKNVSAWNVSQAALLIANVNSWESLGFKMQQVPSLSRLLSMESKINAFIHCFVAARRITSLHDMEVAICKNEGVKRFEELDLGPLLQHPLAIHYFSLSSDLTEIYKITTEDIISYLCDFIKTHKRKELEVCNFLDFVSEKKSVTSREKLCIRIHAFRFFVSHMTRVMKCEGSLLEGVSEKIRLKSIRNKPNPPLSTKKRELDSNFNAISQRMKSFSASAHFCGQHIRFSSSCSEDNDSENEEQPDVENSGRDCRVSLPNAVSDRLSSCPYPSANEEMTRLAMKSADPNSGLRVGVRYSADKKLPQRKRSSTSNIAHNKWAKRAKFQSRWNISNHVLSSPFSNESLQIFVTTWNEACKENCEDKVLEMMLRYYNTRKKKKVKELFTSNPFAGLLSAAVTSIKLGILNNVHNISQELNQQDMDEVSQVNSDTYIDGGEIATVANFVTKSENISRKPDVRAEDILMKLSEYFEIVINSHKSPSIGKFQLLRKFCMSEKWLTEEFSVPDFESLGYGDYFMFLDKYMHLLPHELQKFMIGDIIEGSCLEAHLLPVQLDMLLLQALVGSTENETLSLKGITDLLARQFPLACFKLVKGDVIEKFQSNFREKLCTFKPSCVYFSSPLLGFGFEDNLSAPVEKKTIGDVGFSFNCKTEEGIIAPVTTADAIRGLLKAPMLTDLRLWLHWDIAFAPSLGSFMEWLLKDAKMKEFVCLVTKDSKVIRINNLASIDTFMKASIQGSSFETAVELLSLIATYGGQHSVPVALLKSHAQKAFEILLKNYLEKESNVDMDLLLWQKPSDDHGTLLNGKSCNSVQNTLGMSAPNEAASVLSRFILDTLAYMPIEFCSFATDILISGMQPFVMNAPKAMMSECKQMHQRIMLHDVGMSLGITEWINDYHLFSRSVEVGVFPGSCGLMEKSDFNLKSTNGENELDCHPSLSGEAVILCERSGLDVRSKHVSHGTDSAKIFVKNHDSNEQLIHDCHFSEDPAKVIETIRKEEFGLDPSLSFSENKMLEKQHSRLGRALRCISQDLYSQGSHFLLELVQNADDNIYPPNVVPMLVFILREESIVVLNNEKGFLASDVRALCDVGNSTKKNPKAEHIGKKGIGFKSVFSVTDAPEIHSNGFHIKFDITEGQIGFVLPTVVPPHDIQFYTRLASSNADCVDQNSWNTCIVLPLKPNLSEVSARNNIFSMFSNLHPSLLLFLRRLQCIKFENMLDNKQVVMRKKVRGNGIVQVSINGDEMTWFVLSQKLKADIIQSGLHTSEISVAFTLKEIGQGEYTSVLDQQPVFAFLPLRAYGLRFILQGDFVLPSSREDVDGRSPWNQWLLSQVPDLFVRAGRLFCDLPCYKTCPGKAVTLFMKYVPMVGEVHGFFASLPRMIISKLRMTSCLLLEDDKKEWVPPFKALRNWDDRARSLLPNSLLHEHLGMGFLDKDIVLSDSLAKALGVEDYGLAFLLRVISALCSLDNGLTSLGLDWLSSWLGAVYVMLFQFSHNESDFILDLKKIPFIPLTDGKYSSLNEGVIWLHYDGVGQGTKDDSFLKDFPNLLTKLRFVSPKLLDAASSIESSFPESTMLEIVTKMLLKVGIQRVSAHEILKAHVLPALSDYKTAEEQKSLIVEYLAFAMFHLLSSCTSCGIEREGIILELQTKALILTNFGLKRLNDVPIHLTTEYGSHVSIHKLISGFDIKWHEIDSTYLKHTFTKSSSNGILMWRNFFLEIGATDFVRVTQVEKNISDISSVNVVGIKDFTLTKTIVKDWISEELFVLISALSMSTDNGQKSKYLLEILDKSWDEYFGDKVNGSCIDSSGNLNHFKSSFISVLQDFPWICSTMNKKLNCPKELYLDCLAVNSILGVSVPYAVPKIKSEKMIADIGLKTEVALDGALSILKLWRSKTPLMASVSQMNNYYSFISKSMDTSKKMIIEELRLGPFIFIPNVSSYSLEDSVPGTLFSPQEVYWNDSNDQSLHSNSVSSTKYRSRRKTLCSLYPNLHDFFVDGCGVDEQPSLCSYLQFLQQLSNTSLPHEAAKKVFEVFQIWGDALSSGSLSLQDIEYIKENLLKKECNVLPTKQDKWVSLHSSYGLICWCDDDDLLTEFRYIEGVEFLYFGEFANEAKRDNAFKVMQTLGIPSISEIVTREAIHYGPANSNFFASLVNWTLPYAQRYIYTLHPQKYSQIKLSNFTKITNLKIQVFERLFYRNVIKSYGISSTKRIETSCLHQGHVLYCTPKCDPHSIFLELSCLFYSNSSDLLFANFLHMITTMAESGATEEQTESFIINSQKVPKLPDNESKWSLLSVSSNIRDDIIGIKFNEQKPSRRNILNSNWPGFKSAVFTKPEYNKSSPVIERNIPEDLDSPNFIAKDKEADPTEDVVFLDNEILTNVDLGSKCEIQDQVQSQQALITGRYGELVAYKYFSENVGEKSVKWVNETNETGLPYDIVVFGDENEREYIEVKATRSNSKLWFFITMREWEFGIEKGECFSIAHVVLANDNMAKITVYKNPARLCQLGNLKLAVVPIQ